MRRDGNFFDTSHRFLCFNCDKKSLGASLPEKAAAAAAAAQCTFPSRNRVVLIIAPLKISSRADDDEREEKHVVCVLCN